jgi:hypothetical protein
VPEVPELAGVVVEDVTVVVEELGLTVVFEVVVVVVFPLVDEAVEDAGVAAEVGGAVAAPAAAAAGGGNATPCPPAVMPGPCTGATV